MQLRLASNSTFSCPQLAESAIISVHLHAQLVNCIFSRLLLILNPPVTKAAHIP